MLGLTFTGEEEQILGATLNAVEVVVHVEQTDGEGEGRDNDTVHLAGGVRIRDDNRSEDHLNDGELGYSGHRETILHLLSLGGGGGCVS